MGFQNIWFSKINISTNENIKILTGLCCDGDILPIPEGFREDQCKFFVSLSDSAKIIYGYDMDELRNTLHYHIQTYVEGRRAVGKITLNVRTSYNKPTSNAFDYIGNDTYQTKNGVVELNYLVIGLK